jgi:L-ascorbate metabolism protein UlaG (beta-lactamase superfamily)
MFRSLAAVAAALVLATQAPAADAKKLNIRWHGQAFFEIQSSKGVRIAIDPHAIDQFGIKELKPVDFICISHNHNDHTQVGVIQKGKDTKTFRGLLDKKGDGKRVEWNEIDQKIKGVHVQTVGVYHDDMQGLIRGKNAIFILEVDGYRIVHLGDLGHILTKEQVKKIGRVDILMIPVGGVYTINGSEAKRVVAQLKPRYYILPMHYGNKMYDDLLTAEEFLEDQDLKINQPRDNLLQIAVDAKPPAKPIIEVLGWQTPKEK